MRKRGKCVDKTEIMRQCIALAEESAAEGEVPVGAAVVKNGEIIATGRNRRELDKNALCHAEIEAIDKACRLLHGWRLWECELYVTLEPCPMCAGAILNARLQKVTYGARDPKNGAVESVMQMFSYPFTYIPAAEGGVLGEECAELLTSFFRDLRKSKEAKTAKNQA